MTDELSNWGVGLGIVTVALFPFAIPIIILTAVALLPLLVPVLALAIVAAVVAAPIALVRRLRRRRGGGPRPRKQSDPREGGRSLRVGTVNADRAG
jgi:membrane protein implicated in regulation of membrane protease activity